MNKKSTTIKYNSGANLMEELFNNHSFRNDL